MRNDRHDGARATNRSIVLVSRAERVETDRGGGGGDGGFSVRLEGYAVP